eukprot:scaffold26856_cov140-Isochrysis_galbana.AAC.1
MEQTPATSISNTSPTNDASGRTLTLHPTNSRHLPNLSSSIVRSKGSRVDADIGHRFGHNNKS